MMYVLIIISSTMIVFLTSYYYSNITDKKFKHETIEEITRKMNENLEQVDSHYFYMLSQLNSQQHDNEEITAEYTIIKDTLLLTDGNN